MFTLLKMCRQTNLGTSKLRHISVIRLDISMMPFDLYKLCFLYLICHTLGAK